MAAGGIRERFGGSDGMCTSAVLFVVRSLCQSVRLSPACSLLGGYLSPGRESDTKVPTFDGNNTHHCSDKGVALAKRGGGGYETPFGCVCRPSLRLCRAGQGHPSHPPFTFPRVP